MAGIENISGFAAWDLPQRLQLTLFSAFAMTWLFEMHALRAGRRGSEQSLHPTAYSRLHDLMRTLASQLASHIDGIAQLTSEAMTLSRA